MSCYFLTRKPGNHELYVSEVAFQVFNKFAKTWGEKYVTSNVKIYNNATKQYEYPGVQYRYWTTPQGMHPAVLPLSLCLGRMMLNTACRFEIAGFWCSL